MENVAPGFIKEVIDSKIKTSGVKTLPITVVNGGGEKVSFKLDPAINDIETKKIVTPQTVSLDLGSVKIEYQKVTIPYNKINEAGISSKEKHRTIYIPNDIKLEELFHLARVARELSVLATDLLSIKLMSRSDLEKVVPLSGKLLYSNLIDPEAFKSETAEKLKEARNSLNSSVISNSIKSLDDITFVNHLLSLFKKADDIEFIKFCKMYESKEFDLIPSSSNEEMVEDASALPVSMTVNDPEFISIGSDNKSNLDLNIARNIGLIP